MWVSFPLSCSHFFLGWCFSKDLFFIQGHLLATGASDSEIFIWDLNNLNVPMTPGSKSQVRRLLGQLIFPGRVLNPGGSQSTGGFGLYHWRAIKLRKRTHFTSQPLAAMEGRVCAWWGGLWSLTVLGFLEGR